MGRPCTACAHLDRAQLDLDLSRQAVNLSEVGRRYGLKRDAIREHRRKHLPQFLEAFAASASPSSVGQLTAEYHRLYLASLDALARAESGVLIDVGDDGREHRRVSSTAIARSISEARKTLDKVVALSADAASENERPAGLAAGELSERIRAQLDKTLQRALPVSQAQDTPQMSDARDNVLSEVHDDAHQVTDAELVAAATEEPPPGGVVGEAGVPCPAEHPQDAVIPPKSLMGVSDRVRRVIEADARTTRASAQATPTSTDTNNQPFAITIPHPGYPGSPAASPEERRANGYPDITITLDDLRSRPELLAQFAIPEASDPQKAAPEPS